MGRPFGATSMYLIASRDTLKARIEEYMREMDQFGQRPVVKGALEHARQNIGLLYAGGRLAIDAGVVPWKPEQLLRAVATCWRRALDLHRTKRDALTQAKRALRADLKSEKVKKRRPSASFSPEEADGYYVMKDGVRIYTVHAAAMRKWLGTDPKQFDRLLDWLDAEGFLMPRQSRTGTAGSDWAIQTPKWPNGKSVRSIVFRDPFQRSDQR